MNAKKWTLRLAVFSLIILIGIPVSILFHQKKVDAAWWNDFWRYRKSILVTNNTTVQSNVYISLALDTSDTIKFQADCGDLRFTNIGGNLLEYHVVSGCGTASTTLHVFFQSFPAGAQSVYYYYGNPTADNGFSIADFSTQASDYTIGVFGSEEISPGPVAYWKFDEGSGTTANDSAGSGKLGTFLSAPIWETEDQCVSGKCLTFDNINDGVSIENENFSSLTDYTMCSWINPKGNHKNYTGTIMSSGNWNSNHWAFGVNQSNTQIQTRKFDGVNSPTWNYIFPLNQWTHVCLIRSGNTIRAYANGTQVGSSYAGVTGNLISDATNTTIGRETYAGGYFDFNGSIDEPKIYAYARSSDQIKQDYNSGLAGSGTAEGSSAAFGSKAEELLSDGLVGYWKMDEGSGNTVNNSGNGGSTLNGTLTGTVLPVWTNDGKFNKALSFSSGYTQTAATTINGTFTFSSWFKPSVFNAWAAVLTNLKHDAPSSGLNIIPQSGSVRICYGSGVGNYLYYDVSAPEIISGKWNYAAVTYDGTNIKLYLNGILKNTRAATVVQSSQVIRSGIWASGYIGYFFNGLIDETKVYNYALSDSEIVTDFNQGKSVTMASAGISAGGNPDNSATAEYCVPGDASTCSAPVGEWKFDEKTGVNAKDTSGNGYNGTPNGNPQWAQGKIGAGLKMDGNDYVRVSNFNKLSGKSGATISFWVKQNSNSISQYAVWADSNVLIELGSSDISSGSQNIRIRWHLNGDWRNSHVALNTLDTNKWNYFTFTFDNGSTDIYKNGKLIYSGSDSEINISTISPNYDFGFRTGIGGVDGYLDNMLIYDYPRTPSQIAYDYNRGAPVGWWKLDECQGNVLNNSISGGRNGIWTGGGGGQTSVGTCTVAGTAWGSGASGKFNASLNFDGTDDNVNVGTGNDYFPLPTFSLCAWAKSPGLAPGTSVPGVVGFTYGLRFGLDNSGQFLTSMDNGITAIAQTVPGNLFDNTFHHLCLTYDAANRHMYVDGIEKLSVATTWLGTTRWPADNVNIGRDNNAANYRFNGQIDDVRIYNYPLTEEQIKNVMNEGSSLRFGL